MAQRATSLGPKPSLFSFSFLLFLFFPCLPFFVSFNKNNLCFPPKKGHFWFLFECLPLFLFSLLGPPPFSISLSLSLSCSSLSFFLSVSHFCIWFMLFLFVWFGFFVSSCSFVFLLFYLLSCFVLNHNI